jgi:hypothetical protein
MMRIASALRRLAEWGTRRSRDGEGTGRGEHAIMRTRHASTLTAGRIALALAACLLPGCTLEQIQIGQLYSIYTPRAGACPRLEWRFFVNAQRSIGGFLSRDGQQRIATLSGVLNADDGFQITATSEAANRTANVTGRFTSQVSTISIHGDAAGSACDGQVFEIRLRRYLSSQGGGGGGG